MFTTRSSNILFVVILLALTINSYAQKIKPEEMVAKHLEAIGVKERRSEIKNILATGRVRFKVMRSTSQTQGAGVLLSEDNKLFFGMKFDALDYPREEIIFDGEKSNVAYISPGVRSEFGNFMTTQRLVIKEGLFGGSLTTAWSLLDLTSPESKLRSKGKKKINEREAFVFDYQLKGVSNLTIEIYFDAETFQHVRTEYRQRVPPPLSRKPEDSISQMETVYKLREDFADYKNVNGLNLPHSYQITLLIEGRSAKEFAWNFEFADFRFNQKLDAKSFVVE